MYLLKVFGLYVFYVVFWIWFILSVLGTVTAIAIILGRQSVPLWFLINSGAWVLFIFIYGFSVFLDKYEERNWWL